MVKKKPLCITEKNLEIADFPGRQIVADFSIEVKEGVN